MGFLSRLYEHGALLGGSAGHLSSAMKIAGL